GGAVPDGYSLSITNPNSTGTIYFTTDGPDPRLRGGSLAPGALTYTGAVTLTAPTLVRARVKSGAAWSPLIEARFFTPQNFTQLQLSEIYYHPPDAGAVDGDEFEFLEFKNTGTNMLDLSGLHFLTGINFTFGDGTLLAPGRFLVLF